jgi:hypothetical protein
MAHPQGRIALRKEEAAAAIGMSVDSFERHVLPQLRTVRRGRFTLVGVSELTNWVERNQGLTLGDAA